jgi:hypothetical protein
MSVLTETNTRTRRPAARRRLRGGAGLPSSGRGSGPVTLEDLVIGIWLGVGVDGRSSCPVCSGDRLEPAGCTDCGAQLS